MISIETKILDLLHEFESNVPDVLASGIVKNDGFYLVDTMKKGADPKKYAAISAGLFALSNRVMSTIEGGDLVQTYVKGTKTELVLMSILGKKLFVGVLTKKDPNVGLIIYELEKLVQKLSQEL